jgi:hypothetical protein
MAAIRGNKEGHIYMLILLNLSLMSRYLAHVRHGE